MTPAAIPTNGSGTHLSCRGHLFADGVQGVRAATLPVQLHVQGVVEQRQAAAGLQNPVGLLEEAWAVEPVEGRHGGHQIH